MPVAGDVGAGGAGGGTATSNCTIPLPEKQIQAASTDSVSHTHTVTVDAATLEATTSQTLTTSVAANHTHMITLAPSDLATLRGAGMVQILSTNNDNHTHTYQISCT